MEYHEFLDTVDELEEEEEKLKHDQASENVGKKGARKLCEMAVTSKRTLSGVEVHEEISSAHKNRLSEDYLEGNDCNLREKSLESDRRTVDQPEKNDYYYKIYTQWANHYLERCGHPRRVSNLQTDLADGIILATIIEAISGQTFPLIVDPVNPTEKYDNITRCLNFLLSLGMKLNGVLAQDIFDGNLKSILKLFYALSRFKQNQKPSLIAQSNFGFSHKSNRTTSQATSRATISNRLNVPRQSNDDPKKIEYQYLTNNNDQRIRKDEFDLTNNQQSAGRGLQESHVNNNINPYNGRQHRTNGCPRNLTLANTPGISGIGCEIPNSVALQFSQETSVESAVSSKIPNLSTEGKLSKENPGRRTSIDQQPVVVEQSVVDQKNSGHEDKSPTDTISKKKSTNSMLEKFKFFGTRDKSRDKLKDSDSKIKFETNGEKVAEKPSASSNSVAGKRTEARKTNVADKRSDVPRTTSNNNSRTALATSFDEQDQKNVGNLSYSGRTASAASKSSIAVPSNSVAARRLVSPSGYKSIGVERSETTDSCSVVKGSGNSRQGTAVVASQLGGIAVKTSKIASTATSAKGTNLRAPQNTAAVASSQQTRMASAKTTSNGKRTNENEKNKSSNIAKVTAVAANSVPVRQDGQISARRASQQAANVFSSKDSKIDQRPNNVSVVHNRETEGSKQSKVLTGAMQLPVGDKQGGHIQTKSPASKAGPSPGIEPAPGFSYETNAATFSSFKPQQKQQQQQPQLGQKQQQQQYQSSDAGLRLSQKQLSQNVKVKKIDSDTQTSSSAIQQLTSKPQTKHIASDQPVNTQTQIPSNSRLDQKTTKAAYQDVRDLSCGSLSSVSTNVSGAGEESTRSSSNSNSNNSASSTDSVIFRPSSCDESGTDVEGGRNNRAKTANATPSCVAAGPQSTDHISNLRNKKCDNQQQTTKSNDVNSDSQNGEVSLKFDDSIKPMQPLSSSSPYAYLRSLPTSPAKPALHGPTMSPGSSMSGQAPSSRLAMYRPLMDTSRSYMNSTRRGVTGNARRYDQDSDAEGFDVTAGYMSDGEILKSSYLDDVNCGYMSEGGVSQYVKRMQQRFREGMLAVKECMEKSNGVADNESTGDASSISSGEISDAINDISTDDNITGSSLSGASSEQNSMKQAFGYLGSDVLYGSHSLPPSQRACLQQTRTLGMGLRGQNSTSCMARADGSSAENWQKYTIPEEMNSCGSGSRMFNRGTLDRSTLPVTARERGDSRDALNSCGRERGDIRGVLNGSGAMLVRNSNQAIITDLKSRSYRSPNSGTAVAINDQQMAMNSQRRIESSSNPRQKRDSETNTDLSALQSSRNARQQQMNDTTDGAQQDDVHRGGGVINAGSQSNRSIGTTNNSNGHHQAGFAGGPGGIIYTESQTSGQYASSSLERQSHTAMLLARKKYAQQAQMASEYQSGSLGRRNSENQSKSRIDGSIYSSVLSRNKSCRNYGNIDDYTAADHGSPGRPLSETITNANGTPSHFYLKSGRSPRGVLSETDSVEDLSYSPYNLRNIPNSPKLLNSRSLQQHNEEMQATGYSQMDNYYATRSDHQLSMSPGSTLHRAESLHMASAKGARGSSLSLMSNSSSVYSTAEEKQSQEIRKLRRELEAAQEKVNTLTTQLSTNAHVVAAFEQSLANMTQRLQHLTNTSQQKDSELNEMRSMIDALKQQNFGHPVRSGTLPRVSVSSNSSATQSIKEPTANPDGGCHEAPADRSLPTTKSVSSLNSLSSACSGLSQQSAATEADRKKKKKSWLKSSFSRAFSRKKSKLGSATDVEGDTSSLRSETSLVSAQETSHTMSTPTTPTKETHLSVVMTKSDCSTEAVFQLKQQLHEKDLKLTDIQLEALSSAHQLEQLYDIMNRMKSEMTSLKVDNERLQRAILQKGIDPLMVLSQGEDSSSMSPDDLRTSLSEHQGGEVVHEIGRSEGKRVKLIVCFRSSSDSTTVNESKPMEVVIGALNINSLTQWELLDGTVRKAFKEYLIRVEPCNSLGLTFDSILYYQVGDVIRTKSANPPKLMPINCLIGESSCVSIVLKGTKENSIDCLAFEMLVPKSIVHRYVSLLVEHRRIILCGPSGTGKTYLAQKLADHVVSMEGKDVSTGLTATFNVDHKSGKELRQYLANIADQCEHSASELPSVIILDNLHHVGSLSEVFTGFLSVKHQQCPYIIGTMNQTTCSTNNLQLHHNFRWVLCANHMEPVKGFLGRYLRHRLVEEEVRTGLRNVQLDRIVDWLPFVWQHVNKFLESRGSSDVTIGPRLFLSCPVDESAAQVWFTDLWNHSIVPYLLEAVREGFQNYGNRGAWEDPSDWVNETYPWEKMEKHSLLRLRPEDVGRDNVVQGVTSVSMTSSFGKGNVANPDTSPRQATNRSTGTSSETGANVMGCDMASTSTSLTPATYSPPPTTTRVSSLATTSSVATK